ncbi:MAG: hypothetical protein AB2A00_01030 [Myxococcota bacterium]
MERRIRLGELLIRANLITELQLKTALAEQQKWGGRLGKILVDMNYVSEDILIKGLSKQLGVPRANLDAVQVPPQVLEKIDRAFCEQNMLVPCAYAHQERMLQVAMSDPTNITVLDELKFRTGLRISPALAGDKAIAVTIARLFHAEDMTQDSGNEEFKITGNSGSTMIKRISDIQGPPGAMMPPPQAPRVPTHPGMNMSMPMTPPPMAPAGMPSMPPPPVAMPTSAGAVPGMEELEKLQKRQTKAIKAVLELLIEKGVFSRDEYVAWMNRRPG